MRERMLAKSIALPLLAFAMLPPLGATTFSAAPVPAKTKAAHGKNPSVLDAAVTIAGVTYPLPFPYKRLLKNGWKRTGNSIVNPDEGTLDKNQFIGGISLANGREVIDVSVVNLTEGMIKICDGIVGAITVTPKGCVFDIAGITGDITVETIVEKIGRPASAYNCSDGSVDYEYHTGKSMQEYQCKFTFEEDGSLRAATLRNFYAQPAYAPTSASAAQRAAYRAPTALGQTPTMPVFELNGALYRLPCPLGEFIENGWKIAYVEHGGVNLMEAGCHCNVLLASGGYLLSVMVENRNAAPAAFSDCLVDTITDACSPNTYSVLRLSGGIEPGITVAEFERILGADMPKPNTLSGRWGHASLIGYYAVSAEDASYYSYYFDATTKTLAGLRFDVG